MKRTQTTITLSIKTWNKLNKLRLRRPNTAAKERFEDVIIRLLKGDDNNGPA